MPADVDRGRPDVVMGVCLGGRGRCCGSITGGLLFLSSWGYFSPLCLNYYTDQYVRRTVLFRCSLSWPGVFYCHFECGSLGCENYEECVRVYMWSFVCLTGYTGTTYGSSTDRSRLQSSCITKNKRGFLTYQYIFFSLWYCTR